MTSNTLQTFSSASQLCEITNKANSIDRRLSMKEKPTSMPTTGCYTIGKDSDVMTSSIASMSSSLASPGDSGVQLLDSESDVASIMSMSGYELTFNDVGNEKNPQIDEKLSPSDSTEADLNSGSNSPMGDNRCSIILNTDFKYDSAIQQSDNFVASPSILIDHKLEHPVEKLSADTGVDDAMNSQVNKKSLKNPGDNLLVTNDNIMTKSDIENQNTTPPFYDYKMYSQSAPADCTLVVANSSEMHTFDLSTTATPSENSVSLHNIDSSSNSAFEESTLFPNSSIPSNEENFTTINLTPHTECHKDGICNPEVNSENIEELTLTKIDCVNIDNQIPNETIFGCDNTEDQMQTSIIAPMPDEQIVYRRQRRKKSKSQDAPKKRVSFHEDILNSTKIDDIHIDRGFITRQPDFSMSFFGEDSIPRKGVVKGRYSWAAEGDSPYYQNSIQERAIKSDIIYMNNMYGSNSSSSSMSFDSTNSSNSSDESPHDEQLLSTSSGLQNIKKVPKSSCLKKPKHGRKYIDTNIVQEENPIRSRKNLTRKISETNILDTNIFGSLKNIYKSLSSSVPLAERGVPEGQEDFSIYSSSQDLRKSKRNSYSSNETLVSKNFDLGDINGPFVCEPEVEVVQTAQMYKKPNLRLSRSEGFYPNYPNNTEDQPENIILCDSNVYEHRGISYSYEYDRFQSSFNKENKPKSSTVYQMLLKDLNFLKSSEQKKVEDEPEVAQKNNIDDKPTVNTSTPIKGQLETSQSSRKVSSVSSVTDWSSDTETVSDISEKPSKHLQSPLRKRNVKPNHYTIQNSIKISDANISVEISDDGDNKINIDHMRPTSSKTSLINRFLRNVTQKKLLDANMLSTKKKFALNKAFGSYIRNLKPNEQMKIEIENEINDEIQRNLQRMSHQKTVTTDKIRREIFREDTEVLYDTYKVYSAYNMAGENKPLIVFLTNTTLYIASVQYNQSYIKEFVLPYTEVNFIMIGPNGQTIYFSNTDRDMQFFITTGSAETTSNLVGHIEMAMRKDVNKPRLPAIKQLTMRDMYQLRHSIYKQTSVTKDEDFYHYGVVNIHDDQLSPSGTPLGPFREGFLMYRKGRVEKRWQIGYFILKGGVLYTLSSPTRRIPTNVTPLYGGACRGAHRTPPRPRPHTFELLTESEVFEFAASDEYEASDWLQGLIQSASGLHHFDDSPHTTACSLIMTTDHLVTVRECFHQKGSIESNFSNHKFDNNAKALSYAAISDLTAFRLPLAEQSWCVLEFACREVHETSGDWLIYFSTNSELDKFLSSLETLWSYNNSQGDSFPLNTVPETELLSRQATETFRLLQQ